MVKANWPQPRPHHVAWQSPYVNCTSTLLEPRLSLPACLNASSCIFPGNYVLPGSSVPTFSSLKTEQTDEVQGFCQYPSPEGSVKESHDGRSKRNANPPSLQKKWLIFDHAGDKTRLFYSPVFPLVQRPFVAAAKFTQANDVNEERQETKMGQNYPTNYRLPEESDDNDIVNEESEMHEDTEEINALLDSDDDYNNDDDFIDDDEVTSTDRSPLARKKAYVMQEQFEDTKEEVDSTGRPNKRQKFVDGRGKRSSPLNSGSSVRLNETLEYLGDAESQCSNSLMYSTEQAHVDKDPMMGGIQFKKDKIRESLRVLENMIPNAKGKEPLLVIDGTIEYLKSLMSQTGTPEVNYD